MDCFLHQHLPSIFKFEREKKITQREREREREREMELGRNEAN